MTIDDLRNANGKDVKILNYSFFLTASDLVENIVRVCTLSY